MSKLVLIRGLPGSGKSTMAKALCYSPDWVHLETDQFWITDILSGEYKFDASRLGEAHAWCQNTTRDYLSRDIDVVVSNTFTTVKELRPYFDIAREFGIVPNVFIAQNKFGNVHNVPAETLARMQARFAWDISELLD
jgi:predicted kinase